MQYIIQLEELGLFALAIFGLHFQPLQFAWWVWIILFLLPDLGMIGYIINPEIGAITYNLLHHRFIGVFLLAFGYFSHNPYSILTGLILLGHSSFDRALGFGLKFPDNFKHTNLGWM